MTSGRLTDEQPLRGRLAENILYFGRVLRAAGLPAGPGRVLEAVRAVEAAGIESRADFYWALNSVFVNRRDHQALFDQAFHIIWRKPDLLAELFAADLAMAVPEPATPPPSRRLAEALAQGQQARGPDEKDKEVAFDATLTYSAEEVLQKTDFESMTIDEMGQAKRLIARFRLPVHEVATRRFTPDARGRRIDMRATLRSGLRYGGGLISLRRRARLARRPPLVILCDISGSMSSYSRIFLHFVHAITNDRDRVHTFLFGTRLTNITRHLRHRDVDVALGKVVAAVEDWSGGTRIGKVLEEFNNRWLRRVLGQGALVLLVSDGLDRDAGAGLEAQIERLHKSCRRLIWLNPLLRYDAFEARASGIRAMIRHVDDFRPVHNLASLTDLADALASERERDRGVEAFLPADAATPGALVGVPA